MLTPLFAFFFANPFALLATAAGAVSIPIIIHLLNRKRFRIVNWAAMRFLLAADQKKSRRLRLEQIILLIVRSAIVVLLLLAMASVTDWAEKFWAKALPDGAIITSPGGARTHRILVLDGSLSMGVKDGETTTFEKARQLARKIIQESPRGDGFSLVLMASSPRRLAGGVGGPSEESGRVLAELDQLRLPHGNSDLAGTLETVADLLKQSPGKFTQKEVYFLSDLQRGSWVLPTPGQISSALQAIQSKARTLVLDVGTPEPRANIAVTRLALAPSLPVATTGSEAIFLVTLHNYGADTPDEVRVSLRIGRPPRKA